MGADVRISRVAVAQSPACNAARMRLEEITAPSASVTGATACAHMPHGAPSSDKSATEPARPLPKVKSCPVTTPAMPISAASRRTNACGPSAASWGVKANTIIASAPAAAPAALMAETLVAAGLPVLEITLRTPAALDVIRRMRTVPGAIVGAGTVLTPADLAAAVPATLEIPTIGIGAGGGTDAQVIVWQDMAGLTPGRTAKFVKKYADVGGVLHDAAQAWAADVVSGAYPATEHTYE